MTPEALSPACRAFARILPDAVEAVRKGLEPPQHTRECAGCAKRLSLAAGLSRVLSVRPRPAAASQGAPSMADELAAIHARAIAAMEGSDLGSRIGHELSKPVAAPELPWPLQEAAGVHEPQLRRPGSKVPAWIWQHVQADVQSAARIRARRRSLAAAVAASLALLAVFGWRIGRSEGTTTDIEIVFVPVSELPVAMSPTAVLRQGLSK